MKKLGLLGLSLLLVGLVTGGVVAEKVTDNFDLSGGIDAPYGFRSQEINTFHNGVLSHSDFVLTPLITLNAKWNLKEKATAFVQFENRRLDAAAGGTTDNVQFGGGDNLAPAIEQAYIRVENLFSKLTMTYGVQDLKLSLRKGEGAFFMDVRQSETFATTWRPLDIAAATRVATLRDTGEYSGFVFNWGSVKDDRYALDIFWGVALETGATRANDKLTGVNLTYQLPGDEKNVLKVLLAKIQNPDANGVAALTMKTDITTIGVGVDYFGATPNLEIYGEVYNQTGTFTTDNTAGSTSFGKEVDQKAMAYRLGARYDFVDSPVKPYVDLSLWNISGGNDSRRYEGPTATNEYTENEHFVSYENAPQSTLILEGSLFGLDLDSNYNAIKVEAGITTSLKLPGENMETPLNLKVLLGMFNLNNEPYVTNSGADRILGTGDDVANKKTDDGLGTEIDIMATLQYSESLSFTLGLGMLTGADFFGSIDVNDPNSNGTTIFDDENFDKMTLVMFGANVKF